MWLWRAQGQQGAFHVGPVALERSVLTLASQITGGGAPPPGGPRRLGRPRPGSILALVTGGLRSRNRAVLGLVGWGSESGGYSGFFFAPTDFFGFQVGNCGIRFGRRGTGFKYPGYASINRDRDPDGIWALSRVSSGPFRPCCREVHCQTAPYSPLSEQRLERQPHFAHRQSQV